MKALRAILSFSLIGILLFSTMGLSVSRHYCMGMLISESFYSPSNDCGMDIYDSCNNTDEVIFTAGCCEDENLVFKGIDVISVFKKQLDNTHTADLQNLTIQLDLTPQSNRYSELSYYPPPEPKPYGTDLLVRVQRFLI